MDLVRVKGQHESLNPIPLAIATGGIPVPVQVQSWALAGCTTSHSDHAPPIRANEGYKNKAQLLWGQRACCLALSSKVEYSPIDTSAQVLGRNWWFKSTGPEQSPLRPAVFRFRASICRSLVSVPTGLPKMPLMQAVKYNTNRASRVSKTDRGLIIGSQ
jgi:hypothetical protein